MGSGSRNREFLVIWLLLAGFCVSAAVVVMLCLSFSAGLPDNIGRPLTTEEEKEVRERNSGLTDYIAGDFGLEELGETFSRRDRRASSNYAIDSDGRIALYVEESNRAWTSGSRENDSQAVTIEAANDEMGGEWHVGDETYEALIELCVDICIRNGIEELRYTGDAEGNLTIHKMFSGDTECPGPYLESRMGEIAEEVNDRLKQQNVVNN